MRLFRFHRLEGCFDGLSILLLLVITMGNIAGKISHQNPIFLRQYVTVVPPISLGQVLGGHLRTPLATSNGLFILLQGALGVDQVGKLDTITLRDLYVLLVKQLIASSPDLLRVFLFYNQVLLNFALSASIVACCFAVVLRQESYLMILKKPTHL